MLCVHEVLREKPTSLTKGSSKMGARLGWVGPAESPIPQATFPLLNAISDSGPLTTGVSPCGCGRGQCCHLHLLLPFSIFSPGLHLGVLRAAVGWTHTLTKRRDSGASSSRDAGVGFGLDGSGGSLGEKGGGCLSGHLPRGPLPFLAVPASGRCLEEEAGLVSGLVCPRGMLDPD